MPLEKDNSKPDATSIRVLIVDDEQEIRMQHVDLLTEWGYIPFVAEGEGETLAHGVLVSWWKSLETAL